MTPRGNVSSDLCEDARWPVGLSFREGAAEVWGEGRGMRGAYVPRAEAETACPAVASLHREMPVREGGVLLWCGAFRRWRKRWVVLGTPGVMLLHKTRGAAHSRGSGSSSGGLGVLVQLAGATVMCSQANAAEFVVVTPSKWYYLRSEHPRDRAAWAASIGRAIVLYNQVLQARIALDVPLVHRQAPITGAVGAAMAEGAAAAPPGVAMSAVAAAMAGVGIGAAVGSGTGAAPPGRATEQRAAGADRAEEADGGTADDFAARMTAMCGKALEAAMAQAGCTPGAKDALRTAVLGSIVGPLVLAVVEARDQVAGLEAGLVEARAQPVQRRLRAHREVGLEEGETSGASSSDWELDSEEGEDEEEEDDEFHDASSSFGDAPPDSGFHVATSSAAAVAAAELPAATAAEGLTAAGRVPGPVSRGAAAGMVGETGWSNVPAGDFVVRSAAYLHNRAKRPSLPALFDLVGVDAFQTRAQKVVPVLPTVARGGLLPHRRDTAHSPSPAACSSAGVPSLLVVSVHLPAYDVSLRNWGQEDGASRTLVFWYRMSRETEETLGRLAGQRDAEWPPHLRLLKRLASGCPRTLDTFKLVSGVANIRDCRLSPAERALLQRYNRKPLLTRPQHVFVRHGNTMEVALDVHRFAWAGRRGIQTFSSRFPSMLAELAFVLEGRTPEFLPERVLCAHTLRGFDLNRLPVLT